jgi:hypothetical protein
MQDPTTNSTQVFNCRSEDFRGPESPDSIFDGGILMPADSLTQGSPRLVEPSTWGSIKAMFR